MRGTGMKHLIRIAAAGILFMLLVCGSASANRERVLTADCPSLGSEAVTVRCGAKDALLALPGFWDLSAVTLELEGSEELYLGQERLKIAAGEPADLTGLEGKRQVVLDANKQPAGYVTIMQGSVIPALFLEVDGEELIKANRDKQYEITSGRAVFFEADGGVSFRGELTQLRGRGNNSFSYPKKPYQFKLKESVPLTGLSEAKTWILLNNWPDISLLRNQIVLDMCRDIGLRYAVGCEQTDVWINGIYQGLYLLAEKIQIRKGRVEITNLEKAAETVNDAPVNPGELEKKKREGYNIFRSYPSVRDPKDITGGYIISIEKNYRMQKNDYPGFRTKNMLNIRIREPTFPSTAQVEYLGRLITETESALAAKDGIAPESGRSYAEYLDTESFARKFLIEDWSKNYDFIAGSQYLYKDSDLVDPLIYAGPAWDYDLSFGHIAERGLKAGGNYIINFRQKNNIYWLLYNHDAFRLRLCELWRDIFRPAAAVLLGETSAQTDGALRSFEEYRDRISASAAMNFRKWGVDNKVAMKEAGTNFEQAAAYLQKWIIARTEAMDKLYGTNADTNGR